MGFRIVFCRCSKHVVARQHFVIYSDFSEKHLSVIMQKLDFISVYNDSGSIFRISERRVSWSLIVNRSRRGFLTLSNCSFSRVERTFGLYPSERNCHFQRSLSSSFRKELRAKESMFERYSGIQFVSLEFLSSELTSKPISFSLIQAEQPNDLVFSNWFSSKRSYFHPVFQQSEPLCEAIYSLFSQIDVYHEKLGDSIRRFAK